jgi:uncharacterized membrane protein YgaE (UPF0421/DUF939 family)
MKQRTQLNIMSFVVGLIAGLIAHSLAGYVGILIWITGLIFGGILRSLEYSINDE